MARALIGYDQRYRVRVNALNARSRSSGDRPQENSIFKQYFFYF
jgi:hypothetical protein